MTESEKMQIKGALRKCAKENEEKTTYTGHVVISSVCNAAAERIEELENDMKTAVSLLERSVEISESLTKAEELLNEFMRISKASDEDFEHDYSELIAETEQFLNSEVEND